MTGPPRISPGTAADLGRINWAIARIAGIATGGTPPNIFTTLGRHRRLFRRWLPFASALMPGGRLPRADSELVILRVAHLCGSAYEWRHHERIALSAGLTREQVELVRAGTGAPGFSERQRLLLRAVDELHRDRAIGEELWTSLSGVLAEVELIELCMLTGHYEMLAMTLNSLAVVPDATPVQGDPTVGRALLPRLGGAVLGGLRGFRA